MQSITPYKARTHGKARKERNGNGNGSATETPPSSLLPHELHGGPLQLIPSWSLGSHELQHKRHRCSEIRHRQDPHVEIELLAAEIGRCRTEHGRIMQHGRRPRKAIVDRKSTKMDIFICHWWKICFQNLLWTKISCGTPSATAGGGTCELTREETDTETAASLSTNTTIASDTCQHTRHCRATHSS